MASGRAVWLSDFELFGHTDVGVRNRKVVEAVRIMQQIWSQDPPYEIDGEFWNVQLKDTVIPELGIGYMPKPFQKGGPPISLSLASPHSSSARTAALNDWGILSANIVPTYSVASHWAIYSKACAEAGKRIVGRQLARSRATSWSRRPMPKPTIAFSAKHASNRYLFELRPHRARRRGDIVVLKPRPDMSDEEATVEVITEGCTLYGSPKTMLDKLVAFREEVGPFGTLLMTGLDWSGPTKRGNASRCSCWPNEVMPKFRQHVLAQAAE